MRVWLILMCLMLVPMDSFTQNLSIGWGATLSTVRDDGLLNNKAPDVNFHSEFIIRYRPIKNNQKIVFQNEIMFDGKGYKLNLYDTYDFKFFYISLPFLVGYEFEEYFKLSAGLYISTLAFVSELKNFDEYNSFDSGLLLDLTFFENFPVGFNLRFNYGLSPILSYQRIDNFGNFLNEDQLFKHMTASIGLRLNFPFKNEE